MSDTKPGIPHDQGVLCVLEMYNNGASISPHEAVDLLTAMIYGHFEDPVEADAFWHTLNTAAWRKV